MIAAYDTLVASESARSAPEIPSATQAARWAASAGASLALFSETISDISKHSDRELAIVGSSLIEEQMKQLILSYLIDLPPDAQDKILGGHSALSAFSSRINLCYAFGFISKSLRDELNLIRNIRNAFAHSFERRQFELGKVRDHCFSLKLVTKLSYISETSNISRDNGLTVDETGSRYVFGQEIGLAITDCDYRVAFWVPPYEENINDPRVRFVNSIKSLYMSIGLVIVTRYMPRLTT